jgi:hypothetical protein
LTAGQDIEALKDDTRAGERGRVRNLGLLLGSMVLMGIVIAGVLLLVLR